MAGENEKLVKLKKEREAFRSRLFFMMIEIAAIFAVPAIAAVLGGRALDARLASGRAYTLAFLAVAFVLSWIIVVFRYRRARRELERLTAAIEEEKKNV